MTDYTIDQLKAQSIAVMTTIHMMKNELSEEVIDLMYAKNTVINNEIDSRGENGTRTNSSIS